MDTVFLDTFYEKSPNFVAVAIFVTNLGFSNFQFFSYSNLNTENSEKTTFSDWNLRNYKSHCKVISI